MCSVAPNRVCSIRQLKQARPPGRNIWSIVAPLCQAVESACDAAHSSLFERLFGGDWRDPLNYHLVLNTARTEPERCAEIILELASRPAFRKTEESRRMLAERLAEARIAAYLAADPRTSKAARNVHISVSGNTVRLFGNVRGDSVAREVAEAVRAREAAMEVQSELQTTSAYAHY